MRRPIRPTLALLLAAASAAAWSQQPAAPAEVPELRIEVRRFEVEGENPIPPQETEALLRPYLGEHRSLDSLEQAAEALEKLIRSRGHPFHRVIVPAQKPARGEIRLQVLQFRIDKITVSGNEHFPTEGILRTLPSLQTGKAPDTNALARELAAANEHPSKRLSLVIKEGENPDVIDAEVRVRDVPPLQTFLGLTYQSRDEDNTGNDTTGHFRLTVGHQRTNLWDRDHALTMTFTTSPVPPGNVHDVAQASAFYWIPLYGYDSTLSFWANYSNVDTGLIGGGAFEVTGSGHFLGMRYTYLLPRWKDINSQNVSLSLEDKYFDNRVAQVTPPAAQLTAPVRTRPLTLRYLGRSDQAWGSLGGNLDYVMNMGGGGANSQGAYACQPAVFPGCGDLSPVPGVAPRSWNAWRWGLELSAPLRSWSLSARLRGQWTSNILIAAEQLGLGGQGSVRGLKDREVSGERGFVMNLEATGPAIVENLLPAAFLDWGTVTQRGRFAATGQPTTADIKNGAASMGLGLRWNWQRRLDASADLAYVLNGVSPPNPGANATDEGHVKLYLSLFYRF